MWFDKAIQCRTAPDPREVSFFCVRLGSDENETSKLGKDRVQSGVRGEKKIPREGGKALEDEAIKCLPKKF